MAQLAARGLVGGEGVDHAFRPDRTLADGAQITGGDWALTALHTPGHMAGHLCLALGDVLFTGDHVMGWAPSLVSPPDGDMAAYMASLDRLARDRWRQFLPAHGDPVTTPQDRLTELVAHRRSREAKVLAAVAAGATALDAITAAAYPGLDHSLLPAARRNALAHLIDLAGRGLIRTASDPGADAHWTPA
jgi:hydroxyacylglutathione hydrolase